MSGVVSLGKQTLAEIVKSKRDASLAKKLERELATKKKEREERRRIVAAEKAKELARLEREKKKLLKVVAQRKAEALNRANIKKILNECLSHAIDGKSQIAANTLCLTYRRDFEQLGFSFFTQIEHTEDVATLRLEKQRLSTMRHRQDLDIAASRAKIQGYLSINLIPETNDNDVGRGLTALKEYIDNRGGSRSDDLQLDIEYWADMKKLSAWKIREICPDFSRLSDAMTISAVESKLIFANRRYDEHQSRRSLKTDLLLAEMRAFIHSTSNILNERETTEKKLAEVQRLLLSDKEVTSFYMSWDKPPTTKLFSVDYRKLNWFCGRASKALFTQISEYLIRNASKSEARLKFKVGEPDEGNKLTIGRETISLPNFVGTQDLMKKIKSFGFNVTADQTGNDHNKFMIEISW